jgi:CheY-like chemotaxis protein
MSDQPTQPAQPTKGTVLFIDDDKFLADMYAMKFAQSGFNVHAALSAAEGLKVLREGFPADAILLDLIMPGGDGFSFLEELRKDSLAPRAVKIAFTNEMNDAEKAKALELGASRYIVKATMIPSEVVGTVAEEIKKEKER